MRFELLVVGQTHPCTVNTALPISGLEDFVRAGRHSCSDSQTALRTTGVLSRSKVPSFSTASVTMSGQRE